MKLKYYIVSFGCRLDALYIYSTERPEGCSHVSNKW